MLDSISLAEVVHKNIVLWKLFKDKHVYGEHGVNGIACKYDPYRKSYSFSMVAKDFHCINHQSQLYVVDENGLRHVYRNDSWMNKDLCPKTWLWPSVYIKYRFIARANFLDTLAADNMDQGFTCFRGKFAFNKGEVMQRIIETELKLDANDKEREDDIVKQIRGIDEQMMPELPF